MTVSGTRVLAKTPGGAAFVKKVTHPPTTIPEEYSGIPDSSAPNVVIMEVKGEVNLTPTVTYLNSPTTVATYVSSKMMLLSPSGGKVASYCFIWNAAPPTGIQAGWVQPLNVPGNAAAQQPAVNNPCPQSANNSGYNFSNWHQDVSQMRTSYKSETYYLNATGFNNQGTVTSAKFKPNILLLPNLSSLFASLNNCTQSIQNLHRAIAKHRVLSKRRDIDEQGFEVIASSAVPSIKSYPVDYGVQILETDTNTGYIAPYPDNVMFTFNSLLADTPSDVLTLSSKAATRPAMDGAFLVHQPVNPFYEWVSTGDESATTALTVGGPIISFIRYKLGVVSYFVPLYSEPGDASKPSEAVQTDAPWNNLDWTITIFDGLTVPNAGSQLTSLPYITVKSFAGLELQPQFFGSIRPFARLLPPPDRDALDIATTIFHGRPDSLPASANDFGTIAKTVITYLPTALSFLKALFSGTKKQTDAVTKPKTTKPKLKNQPFIIVNSNRKPQTTQQSRARVRKSVYVPPAPQRPRIKPRAQVRGLTRAMANTNLMERIAGPASTLPRYTNSPQVGYNPNIGRRNN